MLDGLCLGACMLHMSYEENHHGDASMFGVGLFFTLRICREGVNKRKN